jgi:hypothetical protein
MNNGANKTRLKETRAYIGIRSHILHPHSTGFASSAKHLSTSQYGWPTEAQPSPSLCHVKRLGKVININSCFFSDSARVLMCLHLFMCRLNNCNYRKAEKKKLCGQIQGYYEILQLSLPVSGITYWIKNIYKCKHFSAVISRCFYALS